MLSSFSKKLRFQIVSRSHENAKPAFSNSLGLKNVFKKLRFRDNLVFFPYCAPLVKGNEDAGYEDDHEDRLLVSTYECCGFDSHRGQKNFFLYLVWFPDSLY